MHFPKSTVFLSLLALCGFVAAETPGCLLSVVGDQPNPADLGTICGSAASSVEKAIQSACGSGASSALQAYSSTCKANGHAVSLPTATATASSTGTETGSASASATATDASSSSGSSSQSTATTASGKAASTSTVPGAAPSNHVGPAASFAAAVVVGFAALL